MQKTVIFRVFVSPWQGAYYMSETWMQLIALGVENGHVLIGLMDIMSAFDAEEC